MSDNQQDRVIYRPQLQQMLSVSSETVRRWMKEGRLPQPDVAMSRKTLGWRLSTLHNAGIGLV